MEYGIRGLMEEVKHESDLIESIREDMFDDDIMLESVF